MKIKIFVLRTFRTYVITITSVFKCLYILFEFKNLNSSFKALEIKKYKIITLKIYKISEIVLNKLFKYIVVLHLLNKPHQKNIPIILFKLNRKILKQNI